MEKVVKDFQSKDGQCLLYEISFHQVNNFYNYCDECETWIEFTYNPKPIKERTIKDYEMKIQKKEGG